MTVAVLLVGLLGVALLVAVGAGGAGGTQPYATYESTVAADGPVHQYRFDDAAGSTTLADSVGSLTGSVTSITLGAAGPFTGAHGGSFGGSSWASFPSSPLAGDTAFSAEAWVDWSGGSSFGQPVFDFWSSGTNWLSLTPASSASGHPLTFEIRTTAGTTAVVTAPELAASAWEYVAVTETGGVLTLYVNGKQVGQTTGVTLTPSSLGATTSNFLGKGPVSTTPNFKGSLSNVAFYSKALSGAQVLAHYDAGEFPVNSGVPTISGTTKDGSTLTATSGAWTGVAPITFAYQWERCNSSGASCANISGATASTYKLTPADVGSTLVVAVTANNSAGTGSAVSAASAVVAALAPANTAVPAISGSAKEGQLLTASTGTWTGTPPLSFAYQWQSCSTTGGSCTSISGATASTYRLVSAQVGHTIKVVVKASNAAGSASATSAATATVTTGSPVNVTLPAISGTAQDGQTLIASTGAWAGTATITYTYQWQSCNSSGGSCANISGATSSTLVLGHANVGSTLQVVVTAKNSLGSTPATSPITAIVAAQPPANTALPTISGTAQAGSSLSATTGSWSGTPPLVYAYQWQSCNGLGSGCTNISGATGSSYALQPADVGNTVRVAVTATNSGATSPPAYSAVSGVVTAVAPSNTAPPVISGTAQDGQTLSASTGSWSGTPPFSYAYQWQSCNASGASCTTVSGAIAATFALTPAYVGDTIRVVVTASNQAGQGPGTPSAATGVVAALAPSNTAPPMISGTAQDGQTLSASTGSWSGTPPLSYAYQWQSCNAAGGTCSNITGATASTLTLGTALVGDTVRVAVTASNSAGTSSPTSSQATSPVTAAPPVNTSLPKISGTTIDGSTLTGSTGSWTGTPPLSYSYQWQSCNSAGASCSNISGATSATYTLSPSDVGTKLRVVVSASNAANQPVPATSAATAVIAAAPPANTALPQISGTTTDGSTLTATTGSWTGTPPLFYAYQWQACDKNGANCQTIAGATGSTLTLAPAQVGGTVRVIVTATNAANTPVPASSQASSVIAALAPTNTQPPQISGTPQVGQTLTATNGTWTGTPPLTYSYQWQDCDANGANCSTIAGATGSTYTPATSDLGSRLSVQVTATNAANAPVSAGSAATATVTSTPINTAPPAISGTAQDGSTLSATTGTWTGTQPISYSYQWQACDSHGQNCASIAGATSPTLALSPANVGSTLQVVVTAQNTVGTSAPAISTITSVVTPEGPANTSPPTITGVAIDGSSLSATTGSWTGTPPLTYTYQWQSCDSLGNACTDIAGANGSSYTLQPSDVGNTVRVAVSATNAAESSLPVYSGLTAVVMAVAPSDTASPVIVGSAQDGQTLSASTGSWTGTPTITYAYQWEMCDSSGSDCSSISGATSPGYTLVSADVGSTIRVAVAASNAGGTSSPTPSNATPVVAATAPVNSAVPVITGTAQDGQTLTASTGLWTGTPPISYTYQWQSCDSLGSECVDDPGATSSTYVPGPSDVGTTLRAVVSASNAAVGGPVPATSTATGPVTVAPPVNTAPPMISGTVQDGQTLTASTGSWTGTPPITYTYQWQSCDSLGSGCLNVPGATGSSYRLAPSDVGNTVLVVVTASNAAGVPVSTASATSAVATAASPVNTAPPVISGTASDGQTLSASTGSWTGTPPIAYSYQWQSCDSSGANCSNISDANAATYALGASDVGTTVRVAVTAANGAGYATTVSPPTADTSGGAGPPINTILPTISGAAQDGAPLAAAPGTWSGSSPIGYAYQWQRCDASGADCADIAGATDATYTPGLADDGATVQVVVTATNAAGSASTISASTGVVSPVSGGATSTGGLLDPTQQLLIDPSNAPVVSSGLDLSAATPVMFIESMPKSMSATSVTLGDFASDPACSGDADVRLEIYDYSPDGDLNAGQLVAASLVSQRLGRVLGPITWQIPATDLAAGDAYAFMLQAQPGSCGNALIRSWAHNQHEVNAGSNACSAFPGEAGMWRLWHTQGSVDSSGCGFISSPSGFDPAQPTGWQQVRHSTGGDELVTDPTACSLGASMTVWQSQSVCQFTQFAPPGQTVSDGWYYGLPWTGSGLSGAPRDLYLRLDPSASPVATTDPATAVGSATATLNATVNPNAHPSTYQFLWSTFGLASSLFADSPLLSGSTLPGTPVGLGSGAADMPISQPLTGLAPKTTYTYAVRVYPDDSYPILGGTASFTTAAAPIPATAPATAVTATGATLNGTVNATGSDTHYHFEWDDNPNQANGIAPAPDADAGSLTVPVAVSSRLSGLQPDTTYYYRLDAAKASDPPTRAQQQYSFKTLARAPLNVVPPSISGTAGSGQTLTADSGVWDENITGVQYQWQSCDQTGNNCSAISGATQGSYTLTAGDVGTTLSVLVTVQGGGAQATATSPASGVVQPPPSTLIALSPPSISGLALSGQTLTANPGMWSALATPTFTYQWQSCDANGQDCATIPGATGQTYSLTGADVGTTLSVIVTASQGRSSAMATSDGTTVVAQPTLLPQAPPAISGESVDGQILTASPGTWPNDPTIAFTYQWQSCDSLGVVCADIVGATGQTYQVGPGDIGNTIRVLVTAAGSSGTDRAASTPTPVIALAPPINGAPPVISGQPNSGQVLSADTGTWTGSDLSFALQWQSCDVTGNSCTNVPGATSPSYSLGPADVGTTLRVLVVASNALGTVSATSQPSPRIGPTSTLVDQTPPTITGSPQSGATLGAQPGTWTGIGTITYAYQWQSCDGNGQNCQAIVGATAQTYTPSNADGGTSIGLVVTATDDDGSQSAQATPTQPVTSTLVGQTPPTITGTPQSGATLSAQPGIWSGMGAITYTYQWQSCDETGEDCQAIAGANAQTYMPSTADVGATIAVTVTATDDDGPRSSQATPTQPIADVGSPTIAVAPAISGVAESGYPDSATLGAWNGNTDGATYTYTWELCDQDGMNCVADQTQTGASYTPSQSALGDTLRVIVTINTAAGQASAVSQAFGPITGPALANVAIPLVSGVAQVGEQLSASTGTWTGDMPIAYTYQWQDCDTSGSNCTDIEGATGATYTPATTDVGETLVVVASASNAWGTSSVASDPTLPVVAAGQAPTSVSPPEIGGIATAGQVLSAMPGEWNGSAPLTYDYQWQSCDPTGNQCSDIPGATDSTYTATDGDVGRTVVVDVTVSNAVGSIATSSAPTSIIASTQAPVATMPPAIQDQSAAGNSTPADGDTLVASPGEWSGATPQEYSFSWERCDANGANCGWIAAGTMSNVNGQQEGDYTLTSADVGSTLRVVVTSANTSGTGASTSEPTMPIAATAPKGTVVVSGNATVGNVLSAQASAAGTAPIATTYQWQECFVATGTCQNIEGATSESYALQPEDDGNYIAVTVTFTNTAGTDTEQGFEYNQIDAVGPPANVTPPQITAASGLAQPTASGAILTVNAGQWVGGGNLAYSYQWERCPTPDACAPIPSANQTTYVTTAADAGSTLEATVTATNLDGTAQATSDTFDITSVSSAPLLVAQPTITGTAQDGQLLTVQPGAWSNAPTSYTFQWEQCTYICQPIAGATAQSYRPEQQAGTTLEAIVQARNASGSSLTATTPNTGTVAEGEPQDVSPPLITGTPLTGESLTANPGVWYGAETLQYDWQRCDAGGSNCTDITGVTGSASYITQAADIGHAIRVTAVANGATTTASATSPPTAAIALQSGDRPANTVTPTIEGTPQDGATLAVTTGSWTAITPITYTYQWEDCAPQANSCTPIPGATSATYSATRTDIGSGLEVIVQASNASGSSDAASSTTTIVVPATDLTNLAPPSVPWYATAAYGQPYQASPGSWSGDPTVVDQWQRCDPLNISQTTGQPTCSDIPNATGLTYTPTAGDVGFELRLAETATNPVGTSTVYSAISVAVAQQTSNAGASINGVDVVGQTVTASSGVTSNASLPLISTYEFVRLNSDGTQTALQSGATPSYTLTTSDLGNVIEVNVQTSILRADSAETLATQTATIDTGTIAAPPSNTEAPSISGTGIVGTTLSGTDGTWQGGADPLTYTYQWLDCNTAGGDCDPIVGATDPTYVVATADIGDTIELQVTAADGAATAMATSAPQGPIVGATIPTDVSPPTIAGTPTEQRTLTVQPGNWSGSAPITYTYQWQNCHSGLSCADIPNATSPRYVLSAGDVNAAVQVRVTATNGAGSTSATSLLTSTVSAVGAPVNLSRPSLGVLGYPSVGTILTTDGGTWNGDGGVLPYERSYQWQRCDSGGATCADIDGAQTQSYQVGSADVGTRLRVAVTTSNETGSTSAYSALTEPVVAAPASDVTTRVVYTAPGPNGGSDALYSANYDGSDPTLITTCGRIDPVGAGQECYFSNPSVSPDGQMIAVEEDLPTANTSRIWVVDSGGDHPQVIASNATHPAWTADGTGVIFDATIQQGSGALVQRLYSEDVDPGPPVPLPGPGGNQLAPTVSPDGSELAYVASTGHNALPTLWVANSDGTGASPLGLPGLTDISDPTFTPDTQQLIFTAIDPSGGDPSARNVYAVNLDGTNLTQLTTGKIDFSHPAFTNDGNAILLVGTRVCYATAYRSSSQTRDVAYGQVPCGSGLWKMNPDGSSLHFVRSPVSHIATVPWPPAWQLIGDMAHELATINSDLKSVIAGFQADVNAQGALVTHSQVQAIAGLHAAIQDLIDTANLIIRHGTPASLVTSAKNYKQAATDAGDTLGGWILDVLATQVSFDSSIPVPFDSPATLEEFEQTTAQLGVLGARANGIAKGADTAAFFGRYEPSIVRAAQSYTRQLPGRLWTNLEGATLASQGIDDLKLQNIILMLYRKDATIGDGSTMAAIEDELLNGTLTASDGHLVKLDDALNGLRNAQGRGLNAYEARVTNNLIGRITNDLANAKDFLNRTSGIH